MKYLQYIKYIPWLALAIVVFWIGRITSPRAKPVTIVKHDTLRVETVVHDTLIRWYERVRWKKKRPDTVIIYQSDTIPVTAEGPVILAVDYKYPHLKFLDNYAKMYIYNNVGDAFAIRTKQDGFFVKAHQSMWHWNLSVGLKYPIANPYYNNIYVKGEINLKRLKLWGYTTASGLNAGIELKVINK